MKWLIIASFLVAIAGASLVAYSSTLPVYTDPNAPSRLARQLDLPQLDHDERFEQWYFQLAAFETPHKALSDLGRGLIAGGMGLMAAAVLISSYNRSARFRRLRFLLNIWIALWAVRVPLSFWYYGLRSHRRDYPIWGDSIAIPIFSEMIAWLIGAVVSRTILVLLLRRHSLPLRVKFSRPRSLWGWSRFSILSLWLAWLARLVYEGIRWGNEGTAFSCLVAGAVLLIFLSANEVEQDLIK